MELQYLHALEEGVLFLLRRIEANGGERDDFEAATERRSIESARESLDIDYRIRGNS